MWIIVGIVGVSFIFGSLYHNIISMPQCALKSSSHLTKMAAEDDRKKPRRARILEQQKHQTNRGNEQGENAIPIVFVLIV